MTDSAPRVIVRRSRGGREWAVLISAACRWAARARKSRPPNRPSHDGASQRVCTGVCQDRRTVLPADRSASPTARLSHDQQRRRRDRCGDLRGRRLRGRRRLESKETPLFRKSGSGPSGDSEPVALATPHEHHEDQSRVRKGQANVNLSVPRQTALSMLRSERTTRIGIKSKRLTARRQEGLPKTSAYRAMVCGASTLARAPPCASVIVLNVSIVSRMFVICQEFGRHFFLLSYAQPDAGLESCQPKEW